MLTVMSNVMELVLDSKSVLTPISMLSLNCFYKHFCQVGFASPFILKYYSNKVIRCWGGWCIVSIPVSQESSWLH
jgi:hypothetical protein